MLIEILRMHDPRTQVVNTRCLLLVELELDGEVGTRIAHPEAGEEHSVGGLNDGAEGYFFVYFSAIRT